MIHYPSCVYKNVGNTATPNDILRIQSTPKRGGAAVLLLGQSCRVGIDLSTNTSQIGRMDTLLRGTGVVSVKFGYLRFLWKLYRPLWKLRLRRARSRTYWQMWPPCRGRIWNLQFWGVPHPEFCLDRGLCGLWIVVFIVRMRENECKPACFWGYLRRCLWPADKLWHDCMVGTVFWLVSLGKVFRIQSPGRGWVLITFRPY